jgi:hypothetical protein
MEVTRNSGKRLSFCVTGLWRAVVIVASCDLKWFCTSPRQHTHFPSYRWTVHMLPTYLSFHVGQRNKWGPPVKLLVHLPASWHVKRLWVLRNSCIKKFCWVGVYWSLIILIRVSHFWLLLTSLGDMAGSFTVVAYWRCSWECDYFQGPSKFKMQFWVNLWTFQPTSWELVTNFMKRRFN